LDIKSKIYKHNPKVNITKGLILILIGISALMTVYFVLDIFLDNSMMYALICILFLTFILLITGFQLVIFNKKIYIIITESFIEINRGFYKKNIKIADVEDVYLGIEDVIIKTKKREFHLYEFNSEHEMNEFVHDIRCRLVQSK